jgi:hypothetical protein
MFVMPLVNHYITTHHDYMCFRVEPIADCSVTLFCLLHPKTSGITQPLIKLFVGCETSSYHGPFDPPSET